MLFKDEVLGSRKKFRNRGKGLGRHPFPGPGLTIRILAILHQKKVAILQK